MGFPHPAAGGGGASPQDESPGARIATQAPWGRCDTQPNHLPEPSCSNSLSFIGFPSQHMPGWPRPDALAHSISLPQDALAPPLCCIHPPPSPSRRDSEESFPDCSCLTCQNPLWLGFTRHLITAFAMSPSHLRVLRDLSAAI